MRIRDAHTERPSQEPPAASFSFAGDALVTDVATVVPLLRGATRRREPPEGAGR